MGFIGGLKEFSINVRSVSEWLPWGGLVRDNVVKNKDNSFFGILEYGALPADVSAIEFPRGWSLWAEQQHLTTEDRFFLVICWNPFWEKLDHDIADNALMGRKIQRRQAADYFSEELSRIAEKIRSSGASCRILEYQEIIDFLSFSLSLGQNHVELPDVPLYLDILLSDPLHAEFEENGLSVCGKSVIVLSLPSFPRDDLLQAVLKIFSGISFRYIRRLLAMDREDADKMMKAYTTRWCGNRGYMKRAVLDGVLSVMNGYANEQLIFLVSPESREDTIRYITAQMDALNIPYLLEKFNLKDCWWGSLPGCFRANIRPIISGFGSFNEFLIGQRDVNSYV